MTKDVYISCICKNISSLKNGGTSEFNKTPHVMWSRFSKTKNNGDVLEGLNGTTGDRSLTKWCSSLKSPYGAS